MGLLRRKMTCKYDHSAEETMILPQARELCLLRSSSSEKLQILHVACRSSCVWGRCKEPAVRSESLVVSLLITITMHDSKNKTTDNIYI